MPLARWRDVIFLQHIVAPNLKFLRICPHDVGRRQLEQKHIIPPKPSLSFSSLSLPFSSLFILITHVCESRDLINIEHAIVSPSGIRSTGAECHFLWSRCSTPKPPRLDFNKSIVSLHFLREKVDKRDSKLCLVSCGAKINI